MKNNKSKGFSTLTFVILISSIISFLIISDSFEEITLQTQISSTEKYYKNLYLQESNEALLEIEKIHDGL